MKKVLSIIMAITLIGALFVGCGTKEKEEITSSEVKVKEEVKEEVKEVKEDVKEIKDEVKDKAILVVSFGTSYNDTRAKTIDATENYIKEKFTDYDIARAFTSQIIIDKLKTRDGLIIDNTKEAMDKLVQAGYKEVIVQPLHIINGAEYDDVVEEVTKYAGEFQKLVIGKPVLSSIDDYERLAGVIDEVTPDTKENEAVVLMGHGTHHDANASYPTFDYMLKSKSEKNIFVGTVEGFPTIDNVINKLETNNIQNVTLMPMMVVAGDHANNDMAGDEEDSWKTILKGKGYEVESILMGLGEMAGVRKIYEDHINNAINEDGESIVVKEIKKVETDKTKIDKSKKAIVVVSFGTSYEDTRAKTIKATEDKIAKAYPDYDVVRAFTSQIIIDKLKNRDGIDTFNLEEALTYLKEEGYSEVYAQPLHVINGAEYDDVKAEINVFENAFDKLVLGSPLLTTTEDYEKVVNAVSNHMPKTDEKSAVVFMGHGTHHDANNAYGCIEYMFRAKGNNNVFIGTVEGFPTIDNVTQGLDENNIQKVTLMPLMVVAGDHANNDMAGDEEDSWKTILKSKGFEVEAKLMGLGEMEEIQEIYIEHLNQIMEN